MTAHSYFVTFYLLGDVVLFVRVVLEKFELAYLYQPQFHRP